MRARFGGARLRKTLVHLAPLPAVALLALLCGQVLLPAEPAPRPELGPRVELATPKPQAAPPPERPEPPLPPVRRPAPLKAPAREPKQAAPAPVPTAEAGWAADPERRRQAVATLAGRAPTDAAARLQLERLLDDPDARVAREAAYAVADLPGGRELLARHLWSGASAGLVQLACLEAMLRIGDAQDVPLLLPWIERAGLPGELALQAIHAICDRAELPLPPGVPARWEPTERPKVVEAP